jgi:2-polyprenyl-3-methyl-5-hydroxy-6-metoxy-1,4-benzoquinol methylase
MSNYVGKFVPSTENNPWNKAFDLVREGSTVLDVGCSLGNFGAALTERKGCVVDGIEPDVNDYKEATRRLRKVANCFAEEALVTVFKDEKYDHIVFLDVVEHLYDPVATLKLVKTHLKPGGSIVFSIPNMAHASVRLMLLKGDFDYGDTGLLDNTHLHFYTLREIERVFKAAGYSINLLDNTEATYPIGLIDDQLKEYGISMTPKLEKLLNSDEARVFQYVGTAVDAKAHKVARKQFSPDPQGTISLWYQGHLQARDREIQTLKNQLEVQAKTIENQAKTLNNHAELVRTIRFRRYLKLYALNKAAALKRRWQHKV